MSTRRPGQKVNLPTPKTPRTEAELQQEYSRLLGEFGGVTFQIETRNAQLTVLKQQLVEIMNEFNARKALDAKAATQTTGDTNGNS